MPLRTENTNLYIVVIKYIYFGELLKSKMFEGISI